MEKLYSFLVLVKHKNYEKAAQELFLSSSALYARIQNLEEDLETELVERGKRTVQLTKKGEKFLLSASKITSDYERLKNEMKEHTISNLKIGVSSYFIAQDLYKALIKVKSMKNLISSISPISQDFSGFLENGVVDVVISTYLPQSRNIQREAFFEEDFVLIVPNVPENENIHSIDEYFKRYKVYCDASEDDQEKLKNQFQMKSLHRVEELQLLIDIVEENNGIAFVPASAVKSQPHKPIKILSEKFVNPLKFRVYFSYIKNSDEIRELKRLILQNSKVFSQQKL